MNAAQILARELALRDCPKQEGLWEPRGGCAANCKRGEYRTDVAASCWFQYGVDKAIEDASKWPTSASTGSTLTPEFSGAEGVRWNEKLDTVMQRER